jgi:hypothetical protein
MRNARSSVDDAPLKSPCASNVRDWVTSDRVAGERLFWRGGLACGEPGTGEIDDGEALGAGELGGGEPGCGRRAGAGQPLSIAAAPSTRANAFSE